jgi:hypothetical protein
MLVGLDHCHLRLSFADFPKELRFFCFWMSSRNVGPVGKKADLRVWDIDGYRYSSGGSETCCCMRSGLVVRVVEVVEVWRDCNGSRTAVEGIRSWSYQFGRTCCELVECLRRAEEGFLNCSGLIEVGGEGEEHPPLPTQELSLRRSTTFLASPYRLVHFFPNRTFRLAKDLDARPGIVAWPA